MALSFLATMAQEESHIKSDIMNASLEMRFRRGILLTPALLGYDRDEDGNLIINEEEPIQSEPNLKLSLKSIGVNEGSKDVHVLNFNYTDTCERFYKSKFSGYCDLNIKPVYVHGKVSSGEECNLVLGTHGFERYNGIISKDFNIFKKHNQRHKFGTIEAYQTLLELIKEHNRQITFHIIGHSLDSTDQRILKHILLANQHSRINIYYHDEEAQERLMNNIDSIIGEEEVMAKVRFINQYDSERGILILKEESVLVEN